MPKIKPLTPRFAQHVDYINNTAQVPLSVEEFDEGWEPIGPMVREEMLEDGYIYMGGPDIFGYEARDGIYLRPDLKRT